MITFRAKDGATGQEVVLTIRYGHVCNEGSLSYLRLIWFRTSGTEPKVTLCSPKAVYLSLTKDETDQILLGRPREGRGVVGRPAWKGCPCSPGRLVGSDEKRLVTPCVIYHTYFQSVPYDVAATVEPSECVSCFAIQTLPFFTASSLTLASIEFFFTL